MTITPEATEERMDKHAAIRSSVPSAGGTRNELAAVGSDGRRLAPLPHCIDCEARITRGAVRCLSCAVKYRKTLPAPNLNGRPSETRVTIGIGVWWPVKKMRPKPSGCWMCAHRVFIGGHVHKDGSRG